MPQAERAAASRGRAEAAAPGPDVAGHAGRPAGPDGGAAQTAVPVSRHERASGPAAGGARAKRYGRTLSLSRSAPRARADGLNLKNVR